eukprot:2461482-Rhodomonas_salina.6
MEAMLLFTEAVLAYMGAIAGVYGSDADCYGSCIRSTCAQSRERPRRYHQEHGTPFSVSPYAPATPCPVLN